MYVYIVEMGLKLPVNGSKIKILSVAAYAEKWEKLLTGQRDQLNDALEQVTRFRGQLLQEEQISQKMTRTRNARYN